MATAPEISLPLLGTLIDNGALELTELLGQGGYGIVYRAVNTRSLVPTSYAVKCLPHAQASRSSRRRQLHIREIRLHKLASTHPNVVSLHKVVEDKDFTYIIMDYCEDGDLFTQILHQRRYLGQDELIKHVFLQLLDAVEYCHSLGIYHRDLKPENVLCFDGGLRLAITDFGLATLDTVSEEFRTGSAYHMSPECHGGPFAPNGSYSPLYNDVWSLGIILLNLLTGRNPWKSASLSDPTFYAYLQDPLHFLPTVLPISDKVNHLLIRTLEVDWRRRTTLLEMKAVVKSIDNFYSDDVVFEGSMARCTWEVGMDIGSEACESQQQEVLEAPKHNSSVSRWSSESKSDSEMVFAAHSAADSSIWKYSMSNDATCGLQPSMRSSSLCDTFISSEARHMETTEPSLSQSAWSVPSRSSSQSVGSYPATPNDPSAQFPPKRLTINTAGCNTGYYRNSVTMKSDGSYSMYTAMESSAASPTSGLFSSSTLCSKPSVPAFNDSDLASDKEMRDDSMKMPYVGGDSTGEDSSSQSERTGSPVPELRLALASASGPQTKEDVDGESWKFSDTESMHQRKGPWTTTRALDSPSSAMFNGKGTGGDFIFEQDLGFFGDDELEPSSSWPKPWTMTVFSAPSQNNGSSPLPESSRTKPIDIPVPASTKPRPDRKRRKTGFFRDHIRLSFPHASSSSVQREKTFLTPPSPPTTNHQPLSSSLMAEAVIYGDTSGHCTSWARRGRFGGRLSSRTRKNWLLFSPGKLFGVSG